jgi:hypothetical protein
MPQRFALDRFRSAAYYVGTLGLAVALGACRGGPAPVVPTGLPTLSRDRVVQWVDGLVPTASLRYELRWTYRTQQGSARGRATVRFVPPDSVRFDYRGPFGRSGAAVVFGEDVQWSQPEKDVNALVETATLFWALIGIPRVPAPHQSISGRESATERVWRYAAGQDTLTYVYRTASLRLLLAELRIAGKTRGLVETTFSDSTAYPAHAGARFVQDGWSFTVEVQRIDTLRAIDPAIWREP